MTPARQTIRAALNSASDILCEVRRSATELGLDLSHATLSFSVEGKRYQAIYDRG